MRLGRSEGSLAARLLVGLLLAALSGCGRKYTLIGRVLVAPEGEAKSRILEVTPGPVPILGTPVEGAQVQLFHQLEKAGLPLSGSAWTRSDSTDATGWFRLFSYAAPGKESKVLLQATAAGYEAVRHAYIDFKDPDAQYFLILLVPSKAKLYGALGTAANTTPTTTAINEAVDSSRAGGIDRLCATRGESSFDRASRAQSNSH